MSSVAISPNPAHLEVVHGRSQFTPISLRQFCQGRRLPKGGYSDAGTGLSKSSVTDALNEVIEKGIILRKKQSGWQGKALTSYYAVDWEKVFDLAAKLKKRRSPKGAMRLLIFSGDPARQPQASGDSGAAPRRSATYACPRECGF